MPPVPTWFSRPTVAANLWDYGEDALVDVVLALDDAGLRAVQDVAAVYRDETFPLPVPGRVTLGHVLALAAVTHLEGALRPLARTRRRPRRGRPPHLEEALERAARTPGADLWRPGLRWDER